MTRVTVVPNSPHRAERSGFNTYTGPLKFRIGERNSATPKTLTVSVNGVTVGFSQRRSSVQQNSCLGFQSL